MWQFLMNSIIPVILAIFSTKLHKLVLPISCLYQYSYLTLKAHTVSHSSEELDACRVVRVWLHCVDPDVIPEQGGRGVLFRI